MNELQRQATALLRAGRRRLATHRGVVGLDGFVDQIVRVVERVDTRGRDVFYQDIASLAERIRRAAGQSTALKLSVEQVKLGGNGPIMANALARLGLKLTYLGNVGAGKGLHPVFAPMTKHCRVIAVGEVAKTDALEFRDGKLMLQQMQCLDDLSFAAIVQRVGGVEPLVRLFAAADFVALNHWASLPHMSNIWQQLQRHVGPKLRPRPRWLFFDLADTEKRSRADVRGALKQAAAFGRWYHTMLGLNERESQQIAAALGCEPKAKDRRELAVARAAAIRAATGFGCVAVHPLEFAAAADAAGTAVVAGPYTPTPKISTGAGDHFNSGFCLGRILGGSLAVSLQVGVATSGYYVRTGVSPSLGQLAGFLRQRGRGVHAD